ARRDARRAGTVRPRRPPRRHRHRDGSDLRPDRAQVASARSARASEPVPRGARAHRPRARLVSAVPTFTLMPDYQWAREPVPAALIEGVLPPGVIELFGPSGAGKTFVTLSLVTAISLAPDWLGHRVITPGRCVYAVGEGYGLFPRRLHALRTSYG